MPRAREMSDVKLCCRDLVELLAASKPRRQEQPQVRVVLNSIDLFVS